MRFLEPMTPMPQYISLVTSIHPVREGVKLAVMPQYVLSLHNPVGSARYLRKPLLYIMECSKQI